MDETTDTLQTEKNKEDEVNPVEFVIKNIAGAMEIIYKCSTKVEVIGQLFQLKARRRKRQLCI